MRLWKRISLFFVYPVLFMMAGFLAHMAVQEFFYPNQKPQTVRERMAQQEYGQDTGQDQADAAETIAALEQTDSRITCDTWLLIRSYDLGAGTSEEQKEAVPEKYIGMDRNGFLNAMELYNASPALSDLNRGFLSLTVESFSPEEVVVRKNYQYTEKCTEFYLAVENNYVVVYEKDKSTRYMSTGIPLKSLSPELQDEIMGFKYVGSEPELYNFLESYSS